MSYSKEFRTEAMVRLAINKYDYEQTAEQIDVAPNTLRNWEKQYPKIAVPELLDRAIERLLATVPMDMAGDEWGIAIGILLDKWLLLQGEATHRSENIVHGYNDLTEEERETVVDNARRIIENSVGYGDGPRSDNGAGAS